MSEMFANLESREKTVSIPTDKMIRDWKLSTDLRRFIQTQSHVNTLRQISALAIDWGVLIATIFICHNHFSLISYIGAAVIIASRQHALLVLVHEAAHFRLAKNLKANDLLSEILCAFPLLFSTLWYRKHHLSHHRHLNTDQDPDWARKIHLAEWNFPQTHTSVIKTLLRQLPVGGYEWCIFMSKVVKISPRRYNILRFAYYVAVAAALTYFGLLKLALIYWFLPFLAFFPLVQRWRSISEHFGLPREHELNSSRNVLAGPIQRFFISPHGVNYHLVHHLFPSVPFYNIPAVHDYLMSTDLYRKHAHNNLSYIGSAQTVWADLLKKN